MNKKLNPYEGDKGFIFVSYSHSDKSKVYPIIEKLQLRYNVWFDRGIKLGKEWDKEIVNHLKKCSLFIYMVSNNSLKSTNCKDEIAYARNHDIPFINILIEDVELPGEFELRYGRYQMCHLSRYIDLDELVEDIDKSINALDINVTKEKPKVGLASVPIIVTNNNQNQKSVPVTDSKKQSSFKKLKISKSGSDDFEIKDGVLIKYKGNKNVVIIPSNVTTIKSFAFSKAYGIISITIPKSVTTIEDNAFICCYRIVEVINKSSLKIKASSSSFGYVAEYAFKVIKDEKDSFLSTDKDGFISYKHGNKRILADYQGKKKILQVPSNINVLGNNVFRENEKIKKIVLPDSVKVIGECAFYGCINLSNITLSKKLTDIMDFAFFCCESLKNIKIPSSVTFIGKNPFLHCEDIKISIAKNKRYSVYGGALYDNQSKTALFLTDTKINELRIKSLTKTVLAYAFQNSQNIKRVILPNSLEIIEHYAFYGCEELITVNIPINVKRVGANAFSDCPRLTIKVAAKEQPAGWSNRWNVNCPVVWGSK